MFGTLLFMTKSVNQSVLLFALIQTYNTQVLGSIWAALQPLI